MSARRTGEFAEQTYQAAERFKANALLTDDSLFTPGIPIWTPTLLGELHARFLDKPDEGEGSTWEKLKLQLDGSTPEVYQLMSEVLYVHYLILSLTPEAKRRNINGGEVKWRPDPVIIPPELDAGLQSRFINPGGGFAWIPFQLGTLIEIVEQWKGLAAGQQESLLKDPWAFKSFLLSVKFRSELLKDNQNKGDAERHLLLHILFPEVFETILAKDKGGICQAKAFEPFIDQQESDVDRKIQQIRQAIEGKLGDFYFYDADTRKYWKPKKDEVLVEVFCAGEKVCREKGEGLQDLANRLYLPDTSFLKEIQDLLAEKRQVIFQGPPGTGKTYVARELARFLAGGADPDSRVTLVQFHPSYAYEDFVQGFRPTLTAGNAGFKLQNGPLLRAAERAEKEPAAKHYLIIDEINRGNLAAVFGELYFLLEYRGEKMQLQYSDAAFTLPKNLFIIGTMNTADRSIALVDLALRRRFYFVEFRPDEDPIQGVLRRWLRAKAPGMEWVADVVDNANAKLADYPHIAIGPSYFMQEGLDAAGVERIWEHGIRPYLAEGLFNDPNRLADFELEKLRNPNAPAQPDGTSAE